MIVNTFSFPVCYNKCVKIKQKNLLFIRIVGIAAAKRLIYSKQNIMVSLSAKEVFLWFPTYKNTPCIFWAGGSHRQMAMPICKGITQL